MLGSLVLAIAAIGIITCSAGLSASEAVPGVANREGSESLRYWTPERLSDALPEPLPRSSGPPALAPQTVLPSETQRSGSSRAPAVDVGDELEIELLPPLFEDEEELPDDSSDIGLPSPGLKASTASGALFTQSRVIPNNGPRIFPFRAVGKLFFIDSQTGRPHICSGAVIQKRLILTAGHCVYNAEAGANVENYNDSFLFIPAYANGRAPFGRWDWTWVKTTDSWFTGAGGVPNQSDFAIIVARDRMVQGRRRSIGDVVGWLGWRTNAAASNHVTILGYPANLDEGELMQQSTSETFRLEDPNAALYGSYQLGGSSGGPFVENFGRRARGQPNDLANAVVGVMSYGPPEDPFLAGTSILNSEFADLLDEACARARANCAP